jgi:bisphosphoglycerate-dependent phosphoglycerate mutase
MERPQYPEKYYQRIEKIAEESEIFQHPERFVQVRDREFSLTEEGSPTALILYMRHGKSEYREDMDTTFNSAVDIDLTEQGQQEVHGGSEKISSVLDGLELKDIPITLITSNKARAKASEQIVRDDLSAEGFIFSKPEQKVSQSTGGVKIFNRPPKEVFETIELLCDDRDIDKYWRSRKLQEEHTDFRDIESPEELENRILKTFLQSVDILRKMSQKDNRVEVVVAVGHDEVLGALLAKFKLINFESKDGRLGYGEVAKFYILNDKVVMEYAGKNYELRI